MSGSDNFGVKEEQPESSDVQSKEVISVIPEKVEEVNSSEPSINLNSCKYFCSLFVIFIYCSCFLSI